MAGIEAIIAIRKIDPRVGESCLPLLRQMLHTEARIRVAERSKA